MILRNHKYSIQEGLNKCFREMGEVSSVVTSSALVQARKKLKPEMFRDINSGIYEQFRELWIEDKELKLWQGRTLIGIDGSYVNLPDTPEMREIYTIQVNRFDTEKGCVQGLGSFSYDLLNEICLLGCLDKKQAEKNFIFEEHLSVLPAESVVVLDRAYGDYSVMSALMKTGHDFVIRLQTNTFKAVKEFKASEAMEQRIQLGVTAKQKEFVKEHNLPEGIEIRCVKIQLPDGSLEVLATSLLDEKKYNRENLGEVYRQRWGIETYFDRLKNLFELERFSGKHENTVLQDFYGLIVLTTIESVLSKETEQELGSTERTKYKANHCIGYCTLLDYLVALLYQQEREIEDVIAEMRHLLKMNPVLQRPHRSTPRKFPSSARKLRHLMYHKRLHA